MIMHQNQFLIFLVPDSDSVRACWDWFSLPAPIGFMMKASDWPSVLSADGRPKTPRTRPRATAAMTEASGLVDNQGGVERLLVSDRPPKRGPL